MVDISRAFRTSSETVSDFFQRPGVGCYIPLYQREYSWDKENIDQLVEDIVYGVQSSLGGEGKIKFLGTIIIVKEANHNNINPKDDKALPSRIDNIIDGQQRLSTLALLSCSLYQRLSELVRKLSEETRAMGMSEAVDAYLTTLKEIFSFDLMRGAPRRKPMIIRGSIDGWTFNGSDDNYKSEVASYIARFIRCLEEEKQIFPDIPKDSLVGENLKRIKRSLTGIENAHKQEEDDYPSAKHILQGMSQTDVWSYERPELSSLLKDSSSASSKEKHTTSALVQLFAFCHHLLRCSCFTIIEPVSDDWAFDMFQSLNATGTPLTALETFKPLVVNFANSNENGFKGSKSEEYFTQVDKLLSPLKTAASKTKLTNDYLTLLGLVITGEKKPSRQFSAQRKWLVEQYESRSDSNSKEKFVRQMSDIARYWKDIVQYSPEQDRFLSVVSASAVDQSLCNQAAFCCLYLKDANHKMANTVLSRFYSKIIDGEEGAATEFSKIARAVTAFFSLWRASSPNAGLDDVYRKLLREQISWSLGNSRLNLETVASYFQKVLSDKGIGDKQSWKNKAVQYLKFNNAKAVCRFALFIAAHDTISDTENPGLMKVGQPNSYPYIDPQKWVSRGLKTIEHVAPQSPKKSHFWDSELYGIEEDYQLVGNLLLLPTKINSSASNKPWIEKLIYYRHLAETDPDNLETLRQEANSNSIKLNDKTAELLQSAEHQHHIKPIMRLGENTQWGKDFVIARTERICNILWDRIWPWLND